MKTSARLPARLVARLVLPLPMFLAAAVLVGQDPEQGFQSGPRKGMPLTKVEVYAPVGPYKGRTFDVAKVIGKNPGAILFMHTLTREAAAVIRGLGEMCLDYSVLGFKSFTIRLGDDRTTIENEVKRVSGALTMHNPIVVSTDGAEGPGDYALNRKATLTLVLVKDGKVHRSIGFTETGHKDVPMVRKAIEEVTGPIPKNRAELLKRLGNDPAKLKLAIADLHRELRWLVQQNKQKQQQIRQLRQEARRGGRGNRRQGRRQGRGMERGRGQGQRPGRGGRRPTSRPQSRKTLPGKMPEDPELQALFRSMISKTNSNEDIDDLLKDVDKRVGNDAALRQTMVEGFKRLLATTYGTDYARKQFKAYVDKHDKNKKPARKKF